MKLNFQTGRSYRANIIERGDKHDQSIVHLLSTLPSETFLVEKKGGSWIVTTGLISPVVIIEAQNEKAKDEKPKVDKSKVAKLKDLKPKKKKR